MIQNGLAKVKENSSLVKDLNNGGVVNIDNRKYEEHKRIMDLAKRQKLEKQAMNESIDTLRDELNNMKDEFHSIKSMLKTLIDRTE